MGIVRKAQLPQILSQIMQDIYYHTPKIVNELINRNELSSTIKSARAKLLNALFSNVINALSAMPIKTLLILVVRMNKI